MTPPAHTIAVVRAALVAQWLDGDARQILSAIAQDPKWPGTPGTQWAAVHTVHRGLCQCQGDREEIDDSHLSTCPWRDPDYEPAGGFW